MTTIAIATKHKKDELLAPLFLRELDWRLEHVDFDTDTLGTFSPEVKRTMSPKDAALAKARIALEHSAADFGLGSEGSIHPHPYLPMVSVDTEVLALVWREPKAELVVSHSSTEIVSVNRVLDAGFDLDAFAKAADLPNHALILRSADLGILEKGVRDPQKISAILAELVAEDSELILESDFRAMSSPTRSKNILRCAEKLIARYNAKCPKCSWPGWGVVGFSYGVRCMECGFENKDAINTELLGCVSCSHSENGNVVNDLLEASRCEFCNP